MDLSTRNPLTNYDLTLCFVYFFTDFYVEFYMNKRSPSNPDVMEAKNNQYPFILIIPLQSYIICSDCSIIHFSYQFIPQIYIEETSF